MTAYTVVVMKPLDDEIAKVRAERREAHDRARRIAGTHDRRGLEIDAGALSIRERALLDARALVLGEVQPGYEFEVMLK